tara:strand:- start:875 stop:1099 length:225 start_codon:yes stop_codon:yes gene_type:complete
MNLRNVNLLLLLAFLLSSTVFAQKSDVYNDSLTSKKTDLALSKIHVIPINDSKTKRASEISKWRGIESFDFHSK